MAPAGVRGRISGVKATLTMKPALEHLHASGFLVPVCFPTSESCTVICHTPKQALHSWSISGSQLALT